MRRVMVLGLAACGGAPPTGGVGNAAPVVETLPGARPFPAFARADVVVAAQSGELVAYSLVDDVVAELGRVKLVETEETYTFGEPLVFLDRDHLVVRGDSETTYWIVTPAGASLLTAPGDDLFASIPRPASADPELVRGSGGSAVRHGRELYWEHCAWGYPLDGFQCLASGFVRMWPPDPANQLRPTLPPTAATHEPTWTDARPAFVVSTNEDGYATCHPARGDAIELIPATNYGHLAGATHWFANGAVLVEFGDNGLADFVAESYGVYASCGADPLFSGPQYTLFRDGLWVAEETTGGPPAKNGDPATVSRLRRHLEVLADLPPYRGVAIRPTP